MNLNFWLLAITAVFLITLGSQAEGKKKKKPNAKNARENMIKQFSQIKAEKKMQSDPGGDKKTLQGSYKTTGRR